MYSEMPASVSSRRPLWLQICFWVSLAISVAVVIRRVLAIASPSKGPEMIRSMDLHFEAHTALTLAHILGALLFIVVTPYVVLRAESGRLRDAWFLLGIWTGLSGLAMTALSIGGWIERTAIYFFATLLLWELWRAFQTRHHAFENRRWILRATGTVLGIATTRPVVGFFFATSRLTHLTPQQFFGVAFWIGFSINVLATEWWVRRSAVTDKLPAIS